MLLNSADPDCAEGSHDRLWHWLCDEVWGTLDWTVDKSRLKTVLGRELDLWSAKPFDDLVAELAYTVVYTTDDPESCQVEVQMLEHRAEYIHVGLGVNDGGWRAFVPVSSSFIVYRDGRVEKPELR